MNEFENDWYAVHPRNAPLTTDNIRKLWEFKQKQLSAAHFELASIHAVTLCIACVKEVDKSAPYTVQAVQQMAMRINELEKK